MSNARYSASICCSASKRSRSLIALGGTTLLILDNRRLYTLDKRRFQRLRHLLPYLQERRYVWANCERLDQRLKLRLPILWLNSHRGGTQVFLKLEVKLQRLDETHCIIGIVWKHMCA